MLCIIILSNVILISWRKHPQSRIISSLIVFFSAFKLILKLPNVYFQILFQIIPCDSVHFALAISSHLPFTSPAATSQVRCQRCYLSMPYPQPVKDLSTYILYISI